MILAFLDSFSNEKVSLIEKLLNVDIGSIFDWFIDNKLSIYLGEDKTKCILIKKGYKQHHNLNILGNENKTKQYSVAEYLRCLLDEKVSVESMAKRELKKLMEKQNFFIGRVGTYYTVL